MTIHQTASTFYDSLARWGKSLDKANRVRIQKTVELVPSDVRMVLDVGCGDGMVAMPLIARGVEVVGIDISSAALRFFQGNAVRGEIARLPFPDRSFDLILCTEVLEHLPLGVFEATLKEMERVSKRYVIVSTPNEEFLPSGFTTCKHCGTCFHVNYHVRSLSRTDHQQLLTGDFRYIGTWGIEQWLQSPLAIRLQHLIGIYRHKSGTMCPICHYQDYGTHRLNLVQRVLLKLLWFLAIRLRPARPRWIVSLYERQV